VAHSPSPVAAPIRDRRSTIVKKQSTETQNARAKSLARRALDAS
jgi:hypothetical protein